MANIKQTLDELMTLDGAMCAAVVDSASGMMLGSVGSGVDMELAAAGNTEVVRKLIRDYLTQHGVKWTPGEQEDTDAD